MTFHRLLAPIVALLLAASAQAANHAQPASKTYHVKQAVTLSDIPAGTKNVKLWIAIPDDERHQELLDFAVTASPGSWQVTTEPDFGNRFMFVEVNNPSTPQLTTSVEFTLRREAVSAQIDPAKVTALTDSHRRLFVDELRTDAPHMEATPAIRKMAAQACGSETNLARKAHLLLNAVADYADHYSKDPSKPKCGIGSAGDCMTNAGGCCTDLHSLFIALARAEGLPARLEMGYRLREANEGKEVDPGYRCWVEYFLPGYGWISADVVEADASAGEEREAWFTGLTERRLWLNEGREFNLPGRSITEQRVNTMVIGYAEIDGVAARVLPEGDKPAQFSRLVTYTEIKEQPAAVAAR